MRKDAIQVIYWDASAILSVLFKDKHSDEAQKWANTEAVHLMSSLSYVETCAVIARMKKDRFLANVLIKAALEILEEGPWRRLNVLPEWEIIQPLSEKWSLCGTDLWHLAAAKSLQEQLPELLLFTFDLRLKAAAEGEKMHA